MVALENDTISPALPLVGIHRVVIVAHECSNPAAVQRQVTLIALLYQRCLHRPTKRLVAVAPKALGEFALAIEQPRCKQVGTRHLAMDGHKICALLPHVVAQDALYTGIESVLQADDGHLLQPLPQLQGH